MFVTDGKHLRSTVKQGVVGLVQHALFTQGLEAPPQPGRAWHVETSGGRRGPIAVGAGESVAHFYWVSLATRFGGGRFEAAYNLTGSFPRTVRPGGERPRTERAGTVPVDFLAARNPDRPPLRNGGAAMN